MAEPVIKDTGLIPAITELEVETAPLSSPKQRIYEYPSSTFLPVNHLLSVCSIQNQKGFPVSSFPGFVLILKEQKLELRVLVIFTPWKTATVKRTKGLW